VSAQPSPAPQSGGTSPLLAVVLVVIVVVVLSAIKQTKKWAYWIGGAVLVMLLYPSWRKSGFSVPTFGGSSST
jgi:bacteriorhodopsin